MQNVFLEIWKNYLLTYLIMTSEKSYIEDVIEQINSRNAKKVAFILILGFASYHGILHIRYGMFFITITHILSVHYYV